MGRPTKQGIDSFPEWKPHYRTEEKFWNVSPSGYQALRSSCSSFIKREDVRSRVLENCDYQCVQCGAKDNLQIDHKVSVYQAFKNKSLISTLNSEENLQSLCGVCNAAKPPEGLI